MKYQYMYVQPCYLLYLLDKWTPLHFASQEGHSQIVSLLIVQRGNVNAKTSVSNFNIISFIWQLPTKEFSYTKKNYYT